MRRPGAAVVRVASAVLLVAAVAVAFRHQWHGVGPVLRRLDLGWLALAALLALGGVFTSMLSWREVLADLGSRLPVGAAAKVFFVGQLGKYVPGSVWTVVTQMTLSRRYAVPRRRSVAATLVTLAMFVLGAALVACAAILTAPALVRTYWWVLAAIPAGLVAVHPRVFSMLANRALRLVRRPPLEHDLSYGGIARSLAYMLLSWFLLGLHVWALARGLGAHGPRLLPLAVTGFTLAWTAGFLVVLAPAGAGIREAALVLALGGVLPRTEALAVTLLSRALLTLVDVVLAGAGLAAGGLVTEGEEEPAPAAGS